MKVAIIGGGISGLSCGWLLTHENYLLKPEDQIEVTLFEKCSTIGMDADSIDLSFINNGDDDNNNKNKKIRIDVPLRVFSPTYYPNLMQLYSYIGLKVVPENYDGSFNYYSGSTYFRYKNYLIGEFSLSWLTIGKYLFTWSFFDIFFHILKFFYYAPKDLNKHFHTKYLENKTFYEYLIERKYSTIFIEKFLLPICSAMCTCSYDAIKNYPAPILLEYLVTRSGYGVRRVDDGVKVITEKLSKKFRKIHLNTKLTYIYPTEDKTKVILEFEDGDKEIFDHVVLATEATTALALLKNPTVEQMKALNCFSYETSTVVVHTDSNLMPKNKRNWASVNLFVSKKFNKPMATIWMNKVQKELKGESKNIFQTWNPIKKISEEHKLTEAEFKRPIINLEAIKGIQLLNKIQGQHHIWICGSYSLYGMPLLENATSSGLMIAEFIGNKKRPWIIPPPIKKKYIITSIIHIITTILFSIVIILFSYLMWNNKF
jgi:predicted NAD/FAD-binding protein